MRHRECMHLRVCTRTHVCAEAVCVHMCMHICVCVSAHMCVCIGVWGGQEGAGKLNPERLAALQA